MSPALSRLRDTRLRLLPVSTEKAISVSSAGSTGLKYLSCTWLHTVDSTPNTISSAHRPMSTGRRILHRPLNQYRPYFRSSRRVS